MHHSEIRNSSTVFTTLETGTGDPVLFLHGFPDNYKTFAPIMESIGKKGFHCIAPVMRGYEPSTISHSQKLHVVDLVQDILGWMEDRRWEQVHLVGHNWGAVIAFAAGMYYPNRIKSITSLGVPLLRTYQDSFFWAPQQTIHSWYVLLFQIPFLAELTIRSNDFALVDFLWKDWSPGYTPNQDHLAEIKSNFQNPGILSSALAYYRNLNDLFTESGRESILGILDSQINVPSQILYGLNDGCFHKNLFEHLLDETDFPCGFRKIGFDHAGHFLHWEKREEVAKSILEWLQKNK
ncbi:alpha/beta hydrolase [Leptospira sp. 85282-16]|uniref:Alpha/beta hydrolase n=1 Tax=Leptospira montravelensis TaxID=2484961 RepID=A0ABY2LRW9_9LEPT|nr:MULTISPECIES: alpha/beta hydrolase [Leptospira]MCT8334202.1 alpha/beta hydrolase [Leptospira sp. 85282-16]TGK80578.1 alpha/beta hydrolase [Leptospira montravelensis]TGL01833.1 alpha/beta hydrolase [Leptospira montravelensis]